MPFTENHNRPNLASHRSATSIWDSRGWNGTRELAVSKWFIGLGGAVLAFEGLRRRGLGGLFVAAGGAALMCWASAESAAVTQLAQSVLERLPWRRTDPVHEAS